MVNKIFPRKNYFVKKSQTLSGITTTTTTTTTTNPNQILLHSDHLFDYYKVKIAPGTRMVQGSVRTTCESAGMKAVCSGPGFCVRYNTAHCVNTPLSEASTCGWPMSDIFCWLRQKPEKEIHRIIGYACVCVCLSETLLI